MPITCNPFAAVLNGQGCEPSVLNQISSGMDTPAQTSKEGPVARSRVDQLTLRPPNEYITES